MISQFGAVFIVDDEALVADYVQMVVEDQGLCVAATVGSTAAALDLADQHRPTSALIDINLGAGGDGVELAKQLMTKHELKVIFISGSHDLMTRNRVQSVGASGFVRKPFLADQLAAAIRSALASPEKSA